MDCCFGNQNSTKATIIILVKITYIWLIIKQISTDLVIYKTVLSIHQVSCQDGFHLVPDPSTRCYAGGSGVGGLGVPLSSPLSGGWGGYPLSGPMWGRLPLVHCHVSMVGGNPRRQTEKVKTLITFPVINIWELNNYFMDLKQGWSEAL